MDLSIRQETIPGQELKMTNDPKILEQVHNYGLARQQDAISKGYRIKTSWDMMALHYPWLFDDALLSQLQKVDAPALSTSTGFFVAVHGALAFEQIINEANVIGLLPKEPYTLGGYRSLETAGLATTTALGQAENAVLPDSTLVGLQNINIPIKELSSTLDISARQQFYSQTPNNVWNQPGGSSLAAMREYYGREHIKLMNRSILADNDVVAGNNLESIDRIVAANNEVSIVDANDLDIYGLDRDAGATVYDGYVNENGGTPRDLDTGIIKSLLENCAPFWDGVNMRGDLNFSGVQNKIWLTNYDTKNQIEVLYENSNRYQDNGVEIRPSINGIQTFPAGSKAGFLVNSLYGIPGPFVSNDVPKDTIGRLYLLDLDHLKLKIGMPTQYTEAGISTGTEILLDRIGDRGHYFTMAELWADRFQCHGKARDLQ